MAKKEKDTFVVLTHHYQKSKTQPGKVEVHETCNLVDRVKDNLTISATCIINVTQKTVVKNRAGGTGDEDYQNLVDYLVITYPEQFKAIKYDDTAGDTSEPGIPSDS
jgi:hypothetical protein